jgi:hypothetical protein
MWTALALASEARPFAADGWRVVESQSQVATMKLVDSLDEQAILEAELDGSKPAIPSSCKHLHYLLATPFRYAPYPHGSRFRRARQREGAYYCAERVETAIAETAFYAALFFLASPGTPLPSNPLERSAFRVPIYARLALDLTTAPFDQDREFWTHPTDYARSQDFADLAREVDVELIRYGSVRDLEGGANLAILSPAAFAANAPEAFETWRILLRRDRVDALREMPRASRSFVLSDWAVTDSRIPAGIRPPRD